MKGVVWSPLLGCLLSIFRGIILQNRNLMVLEGKMIIYISIAVI